MGDSNKCSVAGGSCRDAVFHSSKLARFGSSNSRFAAMIGETPTAARLRQLVWHRGEPEANTNIRVWANRRSGFYYCPKTKFYGKMSPGAYMVQWDALQRGYRPADAQACQ